MKNKFIFLIAAASGTLVIVLGAIGSHTLDHILIENNRLETYQIAVRYHSFQTLAFLGLGVIHLLLRSRYIVYSFYIMLTGTILFSGSLYLLSVSNLTAFVYITPAGGFLLIISWLILFYGIYKGRWNIRIQE